MKQLVVIFSSLSQHLEEELLPLVSEPGVHRLKPDFNGVLYYSVPTKIPEHQHVQLNMIWKHIANTSIYFGLSMDFGLFIPPYCPMMATTHVMIINIFLVTIIKP